MVAGLAKSIRLYFKKHPFAIVGVKGRAKGTPVVEIIQQLEVVLMPWEYFLNNSYMFFYSCHEIEFASQFSGFAARLIYVTR